MLTRALALEATLHPVADGGAWEPVSRAGEATLGLGAPRNHVRRGGSGILSIALALVQADSAAGMHGRRAPPHLGVAKAAVITAGVYVTLVLLFALSLPGVSEVPAAFPATLLWRFRVAAIEVQVVLWVSTAVRFGYLCERQVALLPRRQSRGPVPLPDGSYDTASFSRP